MGRVSKQQYPELKLLHHIPNGGKRDARTAANLKKEGVKTGCYRYVSTSSKRTIPWLVYKLKTQKGKVQKNQKEWLSALNKEGYATKVCYGWLEAKESIEKYLELGQA